MTEPDSVRGERVVVETPNGAMSAYLARPAGRPSGPGLLVIHEAMGLVPHIEDVARRFAARGYTVLAPDLYHRTGMPGATNEKVMAAMLGLPDDQAVSDMSAAQRFLVALDGVSGQVGCIGFCSGGRHTVLAASRVDGLSAAVSCWGGFLNRASPGEVVTAQRPVPVLSIAAGIRCPLYLAGGAEDQNPEPELLEELRATAAVAGRDVTVRIYDDAGHAFFADYRESYRAEPAARLWDDVTRWLDDRLWV